MARSRCGRLRSPRMNGTATPATHFAIILLFQRPSSEGRCFRLYWESLGLEKCFEGLENCADRPGAKVGGPAEDSEATAIAEVCEV